MIVPMHPNHVPQVGQLHFFNIKSLLTSLGLPLCRSFYAHALSLPECFGFVDEEDGLVRGFALGTLDNSRLFAHGRIRLAVLRALASHPAALRGLLFHLGGHTFPPAPELLYEAVAPRWRRQGLATHLTEALGQAFRSRGISHFEIRIDRDNLPNLERHRKLGAHIVREYFESGLPRYLLDKNLDLQ